MDGVLMRADFSWRRVFAAALRDDLQIDYELRRALNVLGGEDLGGCARHFAAFLETIDPVRPGRHARETLKFAARRVLGDGDRDALAERAKRFQTFFHPDRLVPANAAARSKLDEDELLVAADLFNLLSSLRRVLTDPHWAPRLRLEAA
jgi:hypothetical protein